MNVTIYRHQEYGKFIVSIDHGYTSNQYTLYDLTISELAEFIKVMTSETA